MVSFDQKVRVGEEVLTNELQGELVILDLKSECYFGLDEVGTRMWNVLCQSETLQQAFDTLIEEYDVEPDTLKKDLKELAEQLVEKGLLKVAE